MARYLQSLEALSRLPDGGNARKVGGKAVRLAWLIDRGFPVPLGWVLPAQVFVSAMRDLPPGYEPKSLLRASSLRLLYARSEEVQRAIQSVRLPKGLETELRALWTEHGVLAPWGFAVRSSATCEDGAQVSLAGIAESRLGVMGADALISAVRNVWSSIVSGHALSYLAAHGIRDVSMAVVIQPMVRAEASGVLFTQSPIPEQRRERLLNVGLGLGADLVAGTQEPDILRVDRSGTILHASVAHKAFRSIVGPTGGVVAAPVPDPEAPALSAARLRELLQIAEALELASEQPWDVEFACDDTQVWVVQARPVTGRGFPDGGHAGTVWSNANVGEALPGVATPLTWSVASDFSEKGFRTAFAALGCVVPKSAQLVGNVHGRFYLNVTSFMRIAAQVPWLDASVLLRLGGVDGADGSIETVSSVGSSTTHRFMLRLPLTAARLLSEQLRITDTVHRYESDANRALTLHRARDPGILPDEALARSLLDIERLLERTGAIMLTCASSSLAASVALRTLLARFVSNDDAERLAQGLTSGIRDLESARPGLAMMRIVRFAAADPAGAFALEQETPWHAFPDGAIRQAIARFLRLYGDRAVREAELSTPRWREDPTPVLTLLRIALRGQHRDPDTSVADASRIAAVELGKIAQTIPAIPHTAIRHLVARAQGAARLREQMRAWVTTVLGMLRDIALESDRRLLRLMPELTPTAALPTAHAAAASPAVAAIVGAECVFFLTVEELVRTLRTARNDLGPLIRARRAACIRQAQRPEPPTTFVGAPPEIVTHAQTDEDAIQGVGASAGIAEGRARVLASPAQIGSFEPGEILIVHATDIGWTPLFLLAAGVVTELGGTLSHAAIVAREFGVPTVVNARGATRAIQTGEYIRIDGRHGTVTRVAERTTDPDVVAQPHETRRHYATGVQS
jgi:rifampicin phosphotransferase